jgi:hypothetical protein
LRPKTGRLLFSLCEEKYFFQFFLLYEWTTYFTSFLWTSSTSNYDSVWARGKFLLKMGIKFIFPLFFEELLHAAMWLKLPKGWKQGAKKEVLPIESCFFTIFLLFFFAHSFAWCHLQCDRYDLNVNFFIFPRNFTKSTVLKFWVKTLSTKRILAHSYLQIWSWDLSHVCSTWFGSELQKTKKKRRPSNFH